MSKITDVCWVRTSIKLKKFARLGCWAVRKEGSMYNLRVAVQRTVSFLGRRRLPGHDSFAVITIDTPDRTGTVPEWCVRTSKGSRRAQPGVSTGLALSPAVCLLWDGPTEASAKEWGKAHDHDFENIESVAKDLISAFQEDRSRVRNNKRKSQDRGCDHVALVLLMAYCWMMNSSVVSMSNSEFDRNPNFHARFHRQWLLDIIRFQYSGLGCDDSLRGFAMH